MPSPPHDIGLNHIIDMLPKTGTDLLLKLHRRFLARRAFVPMHQLLLELGLRGLGIQGNLNSDNWDARRSGELAYLRSIVSKHSGFFLVDVGARRGEHCREVRRHAPESRCIAIEPHPLIQPTLRKSALKFGFEVEPVALGAKRGSAVLHDLSQSQHGSPHASLHRRALMNFHAQSTVKWTVPQTTLDELARAGKWPLIDLLKIDVEGSELEVIQGARRLLANKRIKRVQFEFGRHHQFRRIFLRDFVEALPAFRLYRILPDGSILSANPPRVDSPEIFFEQNWLALHMDELIE